MVRHRRETAIVFRTDLHRHNDRQLSASRRRKSASTKASLASIARRLTLAERSFPHEILDDGNHSHDELFGTFRDMRRVNWLLGGVHITLQAIERLTGHLQQGDRLSVLDIGTGHADIPRAIGDWASSQGLKCRAFGIDLDRSTLITASQLPANLNISFAQGDILEIPTTDRSVDIAMCSMTLHHLSDEDAVVALQEMARVSRLGVIVNDLTRSIHGYVVAWLLGRLATSNRLTRHDAHRSILRGRTENELAHLALDAGLQRPVFDSTLGYRTAMTVGVRPWR